MITIPPSALEKGARAAHDQWRHECAVSDNEPVENWREWADLELAEQLGWIEQARAAFLAIVEGWPGMEYKNTCGSYPPFPHMVLPFPMPKEASDA